MKQEQPQIQATPYMSPMQMYGSSILQLTNPETEIWKLELTLKGKYLDKEGTEQQLGSPLMNNEGIASMVGQLQTIVNQVTIMSSLDKNEIPSMMQFLSDTISKDLMMNSKRYALRETDRDKVFFSVLSAAFICMKRAASEQLSDKKFWRGSVQEINTKIDSGNNSKGVFSRLNPFAK